MKFLIDMNLSPARTVFLAEAGFEAVHWSNVGPMDVPDGDLMRWAAEREFIVLTADLDFGNILAATRAGRPSVVQVRSDRLTPSAVGNAVLASIGLAQRDLLGGALVSVDVVRARIRILPLVD